MEGIDPALMEAILVFFGLAMLLLGGSKLVDGAQALGHRYGLSPVFIGLTIVSLGTSAPELATTLTAAFKGAPAMALGNVVGSNLANIGLVLGVVGILHTVKACDYTVDWDYKIMLGVLALVWPLAGFPFDSEKKFISQGEGLFLVVLLVAYLVFVIRREQRSHEDEEPSEVPAGIISGRMAIIWVVVGAALLTLGSDWLIDGAAGLARRVEISERVIGLTLLALGTSLPELVSSLIAANRGESELVVGNLVGSNIFNVLAILGLTSLVVPLEVADWAVAQRDIIAMFAVGAVGLFLLIGDLKVKRLEGFVLVGSYIVALVLLY